VKSSISLILSAAAGAELQLQQQQQQYYQLVDYVRAAMLTVA